MRRLDRLGYGLAWAALASCGGGGDGPVGPTADPGQVIVSFSSPIATIGAIQFQVPAPSGGSVASVVAEGGYTVYSKPVGSGVRVIVIGTFASGDVLRFSVPDRKVLSSYTPSLEAAADRTTFQPYAGSSFTLQLRAAPGRVGP